MTSSAETGPTRWWALLHWGCEVGTKWGILWPMQEGSGFRVQGSESAEISPTRFPLGGGELQASTARPPAALDALVGALLTPAPDVATAEARTRALAHGHYENFPVVSILVPRRLRQDFCNIYAFCRLADDLGDELGDRVAAMEALERLKEQTRQCYAGQRDAAVFQALSSTIGRHDIPIELFLNLIDAFQQDQRTTRYESLDQVHDYCRRSADPVGRLVLYLCGYRDARRQELSDRTCTALQLANFWQDVRRDIRERDRIYLPADLMRRHGVSAGQIIEGRCDENYRGLIRELVDHTEKMFEEGEELLPMLDRAYRAPVEAFGQGGRAILKAIRRQAYDTLSSRPALTKWQKGRLVMRALVGRVIGAILPGGGA